MTLRVTTIVGARPQFIKLAPVSRAIARANERNDRSIEEQIVHTGQHYDDSMSRQFFEDLGLPIPHVNLEVGSGTHGAQTALMLERLENHLLESKPAVVLVYGDTNSTLAGALAACKLGIPVAHVEAGLRSFNRNMPEEINRVITDHVSEVLLAPTPTAMRNLRREDLSSRALHAGDVMLEAAHLFRDRAANRADPIALDEPFGLVTIHRAENTDEIPIMRSLLDALTAVVTAGLRLVFPVHPRTRKVLETAFSDWRPPDGMTLIEPLGYLDLLALLDRAQVVITDSGGLQKEALFLGTPCVTLRSETEWAETLELGVNVLAHGGILVDSVRQMCNVDVNTPQIRSAITRIYGDDRTSDRIVASLIDNEGR